MFGAKLINKILHRNSMRDAQIPPTSDDLYTVFCQTETWHAPEAPSLTLIAAPQSPGSAHPTQPQVLACLEYYRAEQLVGTATQNATRQNSLRVHYLYITQAPILNGKPQTIEDFFTNLDAQYIGCLALSRESSPNKAQYVCARVIHWAHSHHYSVFEFTSQQGADHNNLPQREFYRLFDAHTPKTDLWAQSTFQCEPLPVVAMQTTSRTEDPAVTRITDKITQLSQTGNPRIAISDLIPGGEAFKRKITKQHGMHIVSATSSLAEQAFAMSVHAEAAAKLELENPTITHGAISVSGLSLLLESIETVNIIRNCVREKRCVTADEGLSLLSTSASGMSCGANIAAEIRIALEQSTQTVNTIASAGGITVSGITVLTNLLRLYKTRKTNHRMAACLIVVDAMLEQQLIQAKEAQHLPAIINLLSGIRYIVAWLKNKYRRYHNGLISTLAHSSVGLALGITGLVTSAATAGITGAVALGIGLTYLGTTATIATIRARQVKHVAFETYKAGIERKRNELSDAEYSQERTLWDLARRLHPWRHWTTGVTIGDYMRVKIAHFIVQAHNPCQPLQIKELGELLAEATGYEPRACKDETTQILTLANSIPIRGY